MSRGKKLTRMTVFLNIHHLAAHTAVGLESDLLAGSQVFSLTRPLLALTLPAVGQGMLLGTTTAPPIVCHPLYIYLLSSGLGTALWAHTVLG